MSNNTSDYAKALAARLQQNNQPIPSGQVHRDDLTSQQLAIVGWQNGDPIPDNLGARLQELRVEAIKELEAASYADPEVQNMAIAVIKKLGKSSLIKIEDLPPPQQRKVKAMLTATKQQQQIESNIAAADAKLPAFIQGADRDQLLSLTQQNAEAGFDIVDDRTTSDTPTVVKEATPEASPATKSSQSVNAAETLLNCPCCDWPLDKPWEVTVSAVDKMRYLAALLGQRRFERKQKAFGGNVEFSFRTLTVKEYKDIMLELSAEVRNGVIVGNAEYVATWQDMRLAMSLASVSLQGNVILSQPTYTEWLTTDEGKAAEPTAKMHGPAPFYCQKLLPVFNQEPLRLALQDQFNKFEAMLELLRQKASDENFW